MLTAITYLHPSLRRLQPARASSRDPAATRTSTAGAGMERAALARRTQHLPQHPQPPKAPGPRGSSTQTAARWLWGSSAELPGHPVPPLLSQHPGGMLLCQGQGEHTQLPSCSKVCPCHHGRQARSRGRKSFARQEKPRLPHMPRRVFPKDLPSLKAEAVQVATKPEAGT